MGEDQVDPYDLLGVSHDADITEIRQAYHELSSKYLEEQRTAATDRESAHAEKMLDVLEEAYNNILGRHLEPQAEQEAGEIAHEAAELAPDQVDQEPSGDAELNEYIMLRGGLPKSNPVLLVLSCIIGLSTASVSIAFNYFKFGFWGCFLLTLLYVYIAMGVPWGFRAASHRFVIAWGHWAVVFIYLFQILAGIVIGLFVFPMDVYHEYQYAGIVDQSQGKHKRLFVQLCLLIPVAYTLLMSIGAAAGAFGAPADEPAVPSQTPSSAVPASAEAAAVPAISQLPEEILETASPSTPATPSETASAAPQTAAPAAAAGPAGESFTLTEEQSSALARRVALPLLANEWDWNMIYAGTYNPAEWTNPPTVQIADLTARKGGGGLVSEAGGDYWLSYICDLFEYDSLPWDNGPRTGAVFGDGSFFVDMDGISVKCITADALRNYFSAAFADPGIADAAASRLAADPSLAPLLSYSNGVWSVQPSDPPVNMVIADNPLPTGVVDGQITYTAIVEGALGGWTDEEIEWKITLDVRRAEQSRYGCVVTGYRAEPVDTAPADVVAPTEAPPPAVDTSDGSFDENGFIFADSSTRLLTDAELVGLNAEALGFARNEIFARNGNLFRTDRYADHYNSYSWYRDLPNKRYDIMPEDLNDIERSNVRLIQYYESLNG